MKQTDGQIPPIPHLGTVQSPNHKIDDAQVEALLSRVDHGGGLLLLLHLAHQLLRLLVLHATKLVSVTRGISDMRYQ